MNLPALLYFHRAHGAMGTLAVHPRSQTRDFDLVEKADDGTTVAFHSKPRRIFDFIHSGVPCDPSCEEAFVEQPINAQRPGAISITGYTNRRLGTLVHWPEDLRVDNMRIAGILHLILTHIHVNLFTAEKARA
jgi:hypothetical protein